MKFRFILAASTVLAFSTLAQAAPIAFVSTINQKFGTVDLSTGAYTFIANTEQPYLGLNFVNGSLYAFLTSGRPSAFGTVDASTGAFCSFAASCNSSIYPQDMAAGGGIEGGSMYSVNAIHSVTSSACIARIPQQEPGR